MKDQKKGINIQDLLNEFLAEFEPDRDKVLSEYIHNYPEYELQFREAADYKKMTQRLPKRSYNKEEEDILSMRAASVLQNLLHKRKQHSSLAKTENTETEDTSQMTDLIEEINKTGESVESFATKMRLSDVIIYIFNNREVRPDSTPRKVFEDFSSLLKIRLEKVLGYFFQPAQPQLSHLKSNHAPKFTSQMEFSDLISDDPFLSDDDKEYWLSLMPLEKERSSNSLPK